MIIIAVAILIGALAIAAALWGRQRRVEAPQLFSPGPERILFPFVASGPTESALNVALRLTRVDEGTLVPVFLARVPLRLPLDTPLPRQSQLAVPLQDHIEDRAASAGVPVDSRITRGRSYRHALEETIAHERFDRIVVAAASSTETGGFDADDIAWLLRHAPGEIVVLRGAAPQ